MSDSPPPTSVDPGPPRHDSSADAGPTERLALSRHQQVAAVRLAHNWSTIPHVTHHEEADVTALEAARARESLASGARITLLPYLLKAAAGALARHPTFNATLEPDGRGLVLKKYFHVGFAVETPRGLLVPVIRDVDRKSIPVLAAEAQELTLQARGAGLPLARMSGGCFTISSLGSIGGTGFTPIINAPELAILGVSRTARRPVEGAGGIEWRTVLPLSLSYDHRAINGGEAARFCASLAARLAELAGGA